MWFVKIILLFLLLIQFNVSSAIETKKWKRYVEDKIQLETEKNKIIDEEIDRLTNEKRQLEKLVQNRQDRLNTFLYYEIYDAFLRKYGYDYVTKSYTTTIPGRVEVKDTPVATSSDYTNFYNNYKEYLTGEKAPDYDFINAKQSLEARNIKVNIIEPRKETEYYVVLESKASDAQKAKEVDDVYKLKKDKVEPKPYYVTNTVACYKKLTFLDIKMICEHLQKRIGSKVFTNDDIQNIYYIYKNQPEKFREYAKVLDERYSSLYPQNL